MVTEIPKNGLHTEYFENSQEKIEKNYRNGRLHGKWTEWYENGQKKKEGNYTDGITDGMLDLFYQGCNFVKNVCSTHSQLYQQ